MRPDTGGEVGVLAVADTRREATPKTDVSTEASSDPPEGFEALVRQPWSFCQAVLPHLTLPLWNTPRSWPLWN